MTQTHFARHPEKAVMGDYPSLSEIRTAYGKDFDVEWLVPQLADMSIFTGAKNITEMQQESLSRMISVEYENLKVTELLLFFHRFKAGHYGQFYGSFDPMQVMIALDKFIEERGYIYKREYEKIITTEEEKIRQLWPDAVAEIRQQTGLEDGRLWLDLIDLGKMKVRMSVIDAETLKKVTDDETSEVILNILKEKINADLKYTVYLNIGGGIERSLEFNNQ